MRFCDERIQKHLLNGGKIRNNTYEGSYVIYIDDNLIIKKDNGEYYTIKGQDLSSDKWEIVETKYNWDKIIKDKILCIFSHQENFEYKMISILSKKDEDNDCYFTSQGTRYRYCKPFNPADFNIVEDLKEYEL